mmetsp:Transcript_18538/g.28614  ORF Transcript_18538/g.28614 Transcript_18538/m.28614 type:complete len:212 (+) Transcript_18538:174-809(+)
MFSVQTSMHTPLIVSMKEFDTSSSMIEAMDETPTPHPVCSTDNQSITTQPITVPEKNDVLLGTGAMIARYPGNQQFRTFVNAKKELYVSASCNYAKRLIASSVVDQVKNQSPPGRFLKQKESNGCWEVVRDDVANEKACRALRDGAPAIRSKMTGESISLALNKLSKEEPNLCTKLCLYRTIKELDSFRDEEFFDFATNLLRTTKENVPET